jgi:hypothetical protein
MTLLINIQINLLFKRKFPIELTSKFGNLVWPNARAALVLSVSPMFYTGFESLNSVDGLWSVLYIIYWLWRYPKPVDTYKVPTRVTFSDTDSTSSDGSVNRCRYLSYF